MGDLVLKRLQVATEGAFSGGAFLPSNTTSVYSGGSAVPATRRMAVEDATEFGYPDLTYEAPEEARGSYASFYQHLLQMRMVKGKFGSLLYPDDMVWWLRAAVSGNPTVTTLPTAPQTVLASQAITVTTVPLAGLVQPNAQTDSAKGKIIVVTLTAGTTNTTAITFTINGTDVNGAVLSEAVIFASGLQTLSKVGGGVGATSVTLYTVNYFATITSITASSASTGDSASFLGINGFLWKFTADMATQTLVSLSGEFFDGSTFWSLPGIIVPKLDFDIGIGKTVKLKGDAVCKDMLNVSPAALTDAVLPPASSFGARYYSDPIGAVPGTTQVPARLIAATMGIENQIALGKAADGTPTPTFVGRKRYKTKAEITLLFNSGTQGSEDPADYNAFAVAYASRTVMIALPAVSYLPCGALNGVTLVASNWPAQLADTQGTPRGGLYGVTIAQAGKFIAGTPVAATDRLAIKLTHEGETDLVSIGSIYVVQLVNRVSPNAV